MAKPDIPPDKAEKFKKLWEYTDEEWENLPPLMLNFLEKIGEFNKTRMVAEVIEYEHCGCQHRTGQTYVFTAGGELLPGESTVTHLCHWAIARLLPFSYVVYERIIEGLDPTPVGCNTVSCGDVGFECGGGGKVMFRVYCQNAPKSS